MNLNDIIQAAQGGQGINNIAQQFGISPEQAQAAVQAILPGLSHGLQTQASAGGLGEVLAHIANPQNQQAFNNPAAAASPETTQAGGGALGQILGNNDIAQQLAQHAAQHAGLSPELIQKMLPVVAAMVMGGLFHSATNQGLGGMLGQLAGQGNLGSILGQALGTGQQQPGGGGLGGILGGLLGGGAAGGGLGGLLGGLLGGAKPGASALPGGIDPAVVQAGLNTLTQMFGHGVQVPQGQQAGLQDILGQIMASAKR